MVVDVDDDLFGPAEARRLAVGTPEARRRRQSIGVRALLAVALDWLFGPEHPPWWLDRDGGRPVLCGEAAPCISLAHSGDGVICAVSNRPVGVDIEVRRDRGFLDLARFEFPSEESEQLTALPTEQQAMRFYRLWTAREAAFKVFGRTQQSGLLDLDEWRFVYGEAIYGTWLDLPFPYVGAVAAMSQSPPDVFFHLGVDPPLQVGRGCRRS